MSAPEVFPHLAEADHAKELATAAGLTPDEITTVFNLVLKYGPSIYKAIVGLFHHTPKVA